LKTKDSSPKKQNYLDRFQMSLLSITFIRLTNQLHKVEKHPYMMKFQGIFIRQWANLKLIY